MVGLDQPMKALKSIKNSKGSNSNKIVPRPFSLSYRYECVCKVDEIPSTKDIKVT